MTEAILIDDELELDTGEGWVELPRKEVLPRIERFLTRDAIAFELEFASDPTPVGELQSFTWFLLDDNNEQRPALLSLRDPAKPGVVRWFIHSTLVLDET